MGYSFDKELKVGDSDVAADAVYEMENGMLAFLKEHMKVEENFCNTDGIINVAMILNEVIYANPFWKNRCNGTYLKEFAKEAVVPKFEKYIEKQAKSRAWDDAQNKNKHIRVYRKILKQLKKNVENNGG